MTLGLLSVVGCFKHPRVADKVMTCTSDDNCLVGYSCVAGTCQLPGQDAAVPADTRSDLAPPTDTPTTVDAAIQIDAPIADVTVPGTGGVPIATGGITTTGGSPATGGITSTGGSTSTDGSTSTGGISIATGGTGVVSTGGIPGTGGTTVVTGGIVVATGGQNTGGTSISPNLECSRPVNPINGVVSAPILTVGSIAAYDCYTGHQLQGVAQRTCQADLSWSGTAPICAPVDCGPLTAPTNGTVTALDTTYDNRAIYTCVNGTTMTGARARTCQADGTWSGTAPTCECAFTFCDGTCADLQTSNQNCGACGTVCAAPSPSRAQCNLGRCMVALADSMYPGGIGVSGSSFVWTEGVAQTVMKIPVGGGPTTILASDQDGMENLAVDATNAYWTTLNDNHVMKVPLAGGTPVVLAANENAIGIAVDTTHVYWGVSLGSLKKIPIAGGEPTTIATGINSTIVVSGTDIYWGTAAGVSKGPVSGLSATPLVADPGKWFFAVGATHIFWTNKDAGTVMKMPLQGGAATAVATGLEEPYDVAVDSTHVYWGCGKFPFKIMKAPIAGGTPVTIASGEAIPQRMVVDGTSVYWGTINPGIVWRVTPK